MVTMRQHLARIRRDAAGQWTYVHPEPVESGVTVDEWMERARDAVALPRNGAERAVKIAAARYRLRQAVEALALTLDLHRPADDEDHCAECGDEWPCRTRETIAGALDGTRA